MKSLTRTLTLCLGLLLGLGIGFGEAYGGSVDTAINQVDQEYADSQMDADTHRDLVLTLQEAKAAGGGTEDYQTHITAFRLILSAYAGSFISSGAAKRIEDAAAGL